MSEHTAAVQEFVQVAHRVPPDAWLHPLSPGKWSPAEVTSHVSEAYAIMQQELRGGPGLRVRLSPWKRLVLRHTLLRRILASGLFPNGARSPAEIRPREVPSDAVGGLAVLETRATAFTSALVEEAARRRVRLTHTYFGALPARDALRLMIVHTRHHARQLVPATTRPPTAVPDTPT
ncbi:MAG TPA: DinB family protein [Gemmatimonadales bacterium]|nr:DinB family protein [Gemmatimonadales bacterium]